MRTEALLAGVLAIAASAWAGKAPDAAAIDHGRALYLRHCASCHGEDARGGGPVAASLKTAPTDLTRLAKDGRFDADHARTAIDGTQAASAHGTREMPVWGKVLAATGERRGAGAAQTEVWMLVEYLRSIQAGPPEK